MIFPVHVIGKMSPYPTVQSVITPHHKASAKLLNLVSGVSFSAINTRKDVKMRPRNPMYRVVISSWKNKKFDSATGLHFDFGLLVYAHKPLNRATSMCRLCDPFAPILEFERIASFAKLSRSRQPRRKGRPMKQRLL